MSEENVHNLEVSSSEQENEGMNIVDIFSVKGLRMLRILIPQHHLIDPGSAGSYMNHF